MTNNTSHNIKRFVAGVCALTLVSGTVPVQPVADFFAKTAIQASAASKYSNEVAKGDIFDTGDVITPNPNLGYFERHCDNDYGTVFAQWNVNRKVLCYNRSQTGSQLYFKSFSNPEVKAVQNLAYTGQEQALVTGTQGVDIYYKVVGVDTAFSTTVPTATEPGTYTVQWYCEGKTQVGNSLDNTVAINAKGTAENPIETTVTIKGDVLAEPFVPQAATGLVYDGDQHELLTGDEPTINTETVGNEEEPVGEVKYALANIYVPTGTTVDISEWGEDMVGTVIPLSSEYITLSNGGNSMCMQDGSQTFTGTSFNYKINDQGWIVLAGVGAGTGDSVILDHFDSDGRPVFRAYTYKNAANYTWSSTAPAATNAGSYTVLWQAVPSEAFADKYVASDIGLVSTAIAKTNYTEAEITGAAATEDTDEVISIKPKALNPSAKYENDQPVAQALFANPVWDADYAAAKGYTDFKVEYKYIPEEGNPGEWTTDIPEQSAVGTYTYKFRVSDKNHNFYPNEEGETITATISQKRGLVTFVGIADERYGFDYVVTDDQFNIVSSVVTTTDTDTGEVVVTPVEDGEKSDIYEFVGKKTYYLFSDKSVETRRNFDDTNIDIKNAGDGDKEGEVPKDYKYRYAITLPTEPSDAGYLVTHSNNYKGEVSASEPHILNVKEDSQKVGVTAAEMKEVGKIYYGDKIDEKVVDIKPGFGKTEGGAIVSVAEVYLADPITNAKLSEGQLKYAGTYSLTAKVYVDPSGKTEDTGYSEVHGFDRDATVNYLKRDITYLARPLALCDVYLDLFDTASDSEEAAMSIKLNPQTAPAAEEVDLSSASIDIRPDQIGEFIDWDDLTKQVKALALTGTPATFLPEGFAAAIEGKSDEEIKTYLEEKVPAALKKYFTYNGSEQQPVLRVVNAGNGETLTLPAAAVEEVQANPGDYTSSLEAQKNAGEYNFTLKAVPTPEGDDPEFTANYSGVINGAWAIPKATAYIKMTPKNNVDTDAVEGVDAIVYDGKKLDLEDFTFTVKTANDALSQEVIDGLTPQQATDAGGNPAVDENGQPVMEDAKTTAVFSYKNANGATVPEAKNAGSYKASVKLENSNFETVKINGVSTKIAKREVELDPFANKMGYRTEEVPDIGFSYETATLKSETTPAEDIRGEYTTYTGLLSADTALLVTTQEGQDGNPSTTVYKDAIIIGKRTNTGLSESDAPSFNYQDADGDPDTTGYDYTKAVTDGSNAVGKYDYIVNENFSLDNYIVKLKAKDTTVQQSVAQFEVTPLDISTLTNLDIILKGVLENGEPDESWKQEGKSGYYVFDGTTKFVDVDLVGYNPKAKEYTEEFDSSAMGSLATTKLTNEHAVLSWSALRGANKPYFYRLGEEAVDAAGRSVTISANEEADEEAKITKVTYTLGLYEADGGKPSLVQDPQDNSSVYISYQYSNDYRDINGNAIALRSDLNLTLSKDGTDYGNDAFDITVNAENNTLTVELKDNSDLDSLAGLALTASFPGRILRTNSVDVGMYYTVDNAMTFQRLSVMGVEYDCTTSETGYDYVLTKDEDFVVGGVTKEYLDGNDYLVQVKGKGNYTGVATQAWRIAKHEAGEPWLAYDEYLDDVYEDDDKETLLYREKKYDGRALAADVEFTDDDEAYHDAVTNIDIKYYVVESEAVEDDPNTDDEDETAAEVLTELNSDEGEGIISVSDKLYKVVATIEAQGYEDKVISEYIKVAPRVLEGDFAYTITYGEELPVKVTADDIYKIGGFAYDDMETLTDILEADPDALLINWNGCEGNADVYYGDLAANEKSKYYDTVSKILANYTNSGKRIERYDDNNKPVYEDYGLEFKLTIKTKSMMSEDILAVFDNTVVIDENDDFAKPGTVTVYDTSIPYNAAEDLPTVEAIVDAMLENDEEYHSIDDADSREVYRNERIAEVQANRSAKGCKILIPGDEYRIIANNTAISGNFNIRLVGMGNYKLARTETWNALTAEQANESYNKVKEVTNVEIYNFKATETTTAIPRVTLTLKRFIEKNSDVSMVETGILYVQDMENTTPLTIENAAKGLVHKKTGKSVNGSGVYNISDSTGKGVRAVGYVTASYGDYTTTIYTDELNTSYKELKAIKAIKDATSISLSDPFPTINSNTGAERVSITQSRKVAEGFTIVETGFLFVKDKSSTTPLTIGNVGVGGVTKNLHVASNGSKTLHITESNQKGVRVVGFATVTDGVYTTTIYTREVATSYAEIS